jgi:hypothetical protein
VKHGRRERLKRICLVAAAVSLAAPASAREAAAPPASECASVAAERAELGAQHAAVKAAIADIALGRDRRRQRRKFTPGDAARAAAGTAASILLPFGIGAAVGAGLAGKGGKAAPAAPRADVPLLIDRQAAIEERLAELEKAGCPSARSGPSPPQRQAALALGAQSVHAGPMPGAGERWRAGRDEPTREGNRYEHGRRL